MLGAVLLRRSRRKLNKLTQTISNVEWCEVRFCFLSPPLSSAPTFITSTIRRIKSASTLMATSFLHYGCLNSLARQVNLPTSAELSSSLSSSWICQLWNSEKFLSGHGARYLYSRSAVFKRRKREPRIVCAWRYFFESSSLAKNRARQRVFRGGKKCTQTSV